MIGCEFFNINNFSWRSLHHGIIPLTLPHISPKITKKQAYRILKDKGAYFLRWDRNFDKSDCRDWWHIIKDIPEELASYERKTRSLIRKGERLNTVKPCEASYILEYGYSVYRTASLGYDTFDKCLSEEEFRVEISNLPTETEFWGVFEKKNGQLVGFSENLVMDDACFYSTMWLIPKARKTVASFILFHTMNKHYLNDRKLKYVTAGSRNISHKTNIQEFLQTRFMFRKAYSELNVIYARGIYPFIAMIFFSHAVFKNSSIPFFRKISIFLDQEKIRRACSLRASNN